MPDDTLSTLILIAAFALLLLSVLSYFSKRWELFPDIIWILLFGVCYGFAIRYMGIELPKPDFDPELILYLFVPLLVFSATQKICLFHLRQVLVAASLMGSVGIVLSMMVVAVVLHYLFMVPWLAAMLFGVIISATDPLAVSAILSGNTRVSEPQKMLIEGESILNDGFVVTVAGILSLILFDGTVFSLFDSGKSLIIHIAGALLLGFFLGKITRLLLDNWKAPDFYLKVNMSLALAFGSFILAEHLGLSGILSVFAAALTYGYKPKRDEKSKYLHDEIWEYLERLANMMLFFLLGASFFIYAEFSGITFLMVVSALVLLFASRYIALLFLSPATRIEGEKLSKKTFWLLNFAGARGAIGVALILLLPDSFAYKSMFLTIAFIMIIFSLVIYPLMIKRILERQ